MQKMLSPAKRQDFRAIAAMIAASKLHQYIMHRAILFQALHRAILFESE
jgi:hypothetical protein